jgi:hypothetical protein
LSLVQAVAAEVVDVIVVLQQVVLAVVAGLSLRLRLHALKSLLPMVPALSLSVSAQAEQAVLL